MTGRPARTARLGGKTPEYCDEEGAHRLRAKIREYWEARNMVPPSVELKPAEYSPAMRTARVDLRSNMRNGYPPRHSMVKP